MTQPINYKQQSPELLKNPEHRRACPRCTSLGRPRSR